MQQDEAIGTWRLTGHAAADGELPRHDNLPDPAELDAWLAGTDDALAAAATPAAGLTLTLRPDGTFTEVGAAEVMWFDAEGVMEMKAVPFDGIVLAAAGRAFLRPEAIPRWATPKDGRHAPALLRYDDDDTKVADAVAVDGDRLVRTINVVTDELYLNRVVLTYARA